MNSKKNKIKKNNKITGVFKKTRKRFFSSKIINSNSTIFFILIVLDLMVKKIIREGINVEYECVKINFIKNTGIVFGLFQGSSKIIAVASIIVILLILMNHKMISETKEKRFSLMLIISGLLSNAIDRLFLGFATDFLCIGFWPCFNLADTYLVIGVLSYVFFTLKEKKKKP
ncbi:MAG: signal peptidase II [Candidatus Woesearchaeota archaeon]